MKIYKICRLRDSEPSPDRQIYTQCSYCKKWKDESGKYKSIEDMDDEELSVIKLIHDNWGNLSENFRVSHGICSDCIDRALKH